MKEKLTTIAEAAASVETEEETLKNLKFETHEPKVKKNTELRIEEIEKELEELAFKEDEPKGEKEKT